MTVIIMPQALPQMQSALQIAETTKGRKCYSVSLSRACVFGFPAQLTLVEFSQVWINVVLAGWCCRNCQAEGVENPDPGPTAPSMWYESGKVLVWLHNHISEGAVAFFPRITSPFRSRRSTEFLLCE